MDNKKGKSIYKYLRIIIILLYFVSIACVGLYKFDKRSLTLDFIDANRHKIQISFLSDEIAKGECQNIVFPEVDKDFAVQKVRVHALGHMKSVRFMEIPYDGLINYIYNINDLNLALGDKTLIFKADGERNLVMTDAFVAKLQQISASFMHERLLLFGVASCVMLLLMLSVTIIQDWKSEDNWDNHSPLYEVKKFIKDMEKYSQYMYYSAKTDLKAEVANSYLNRLWWLLEPFFDMLVYVIVFGQIMGNSIQNYSTFIYSSLLMWGFFNKTVNYSVKLVRANRDIITKVYVPKFIILFSNMILNFIKLSFSMVVLIPMLIIFRVRITFAALWAIPAFLVLMLLAFGIGMILLHFGVYVDDLSYAIGIGLNMVMFLSGIFYDCVTTLGYPLNGLMLCCNPIAMTIDTMRNALLYGTIVNVPLIAVWLVIAIMLCFIGVHIVYKNENAYVKIV